jgi:hypothetical protein
MEIVSLWNTWIVDGEDEMHVAEVLDIREDKIVASRVYHG